MSTGDVDRTPMVHRAARARFEPALWLLAVAGAWVTVGGVVALLVLLLLVGERVVRPGGRVLATASVVLLVLVPLAWFLGSALPLDPPAARLNDNLVAHHLGGLAVWVLFLAACVEVHQSEGDTP